MIALLGSLLGFGTSFLPQLLNVFKERQDHKNKMEEIKLRGELAAQGVELQLKVIDAQAEIEETKGLYNYANPTGGFAAGLAASVRPVITYMFFALFIATKVVVMMQIMADDQPWTVGIDLLWDQETAGLMSAILAFWFGQRSIAKFAGVKK